MTKATSAPVTPRQRRAHVRSARSDQNDALRALAAALGKHAVATIFGKDVRTVERWLKSGSDLKAEEEPRLRNAFHALSLIEEADDVDVARAWFLGMNPQLDDETRSSS